MDIDLLIEELAITIQDHPDRDKNTLCIDSLFLVMGPGNRHH